MNAGKNKAGNNGSLGVSPDAPRGPEPFFPGETSRAEWLVTLVVFIASCAYLRLFRDGFAFGPDEGITLQGAQRIVQGQLLYRDFFFFMTPGSFYWMAAYRNNQESVCGPMD